MTSGREKRSSSRKPLHGRVFVGPKQSGAVEAKATDLSLTGMCIYIPNKLAVGSPHRITFEIMVHGSARTISLIAEVVFCSYRKAGDFKVGMRFLEIDPQSDAYMSEFMQN